ncbi:hypothetical protein N335_13798, partial [Phaethon lepturus]
DILMDTGTERTDAEDLRQDAHQCAPHVEVGADSAAKLLMEGVDVSLVFGVVGELPFIAVQLHPDLFQVTQRHLQMHFVGCSAHLAILPGQAVDVPEGGTSIVVEGPMGATAWLGHTPPPVYDAAQVYLPGVEADGLVGVMHGSKFLHLILQGSLHVLQLG